MNKIKLFIFAFIAFTCAYTWFPYKCAWAEDAVEPAATVTSEPVAAESAPEVKKSNPPKTLISLKGTRFSGYGGVYARYSQVGDTTGWFLGGRGCVLINDNFSFGCAGMGLASPRNREKISGKKYEGIYDTTEFGYGGFLAEYYINPKSLIVFSFGTLIGGGKLSFTDDSDDDDDHHYGKNNFFVAEPEVNVFVNITRFCRAGIGVSYRYISGIDSKEFGKNDFNGPAASAMIQFGWF